MTSLTFRGWTRDYIITNVEAYKKAIDRALESRRAEVEGEITFGESLSGVVSALRDAGFKVPGKWTDQDGLLKALGYRIVKGKVGKWTKGGYQYCSPADIVTI